MYNCIFYYSNLIPHKVGAEREWQSESNFFIFPNPIVRCKMSQAITLWENL